ncbi:MAG: Asp23/Gls24 family envelope stress response protein [Victivallales bacterium]
MARLTSGTASKKHTSSTGPVAEHGNQYGQIKIHEGAIATIVRKAACSVPGVTRITGNSFVDNIAEIVGSKKIQDRSIQIAMNNSSVAVELSINIQYGVQLPAVAAAVQGAVSREIKAITGLNVTKVNVIVREMEDASEDEAETL